MLSSRIVPALVFVLASGVFALYFQGLMLTPNQVAPTFGGDGLTIHYNLIWHAKYGEGVYLDSQYYPHRESIFMTDAQSLVAIVLAALRPVFPDIGDYAVGISNSLIFWSNPLAALLLFLVLRRLKVGTPLAIGVAMAMSMLAPQILRQLGGQYTLGFTFLFPLLLLYQVAYQAEKTYGWWTVGICGVIILLGLNNPYLYAVAVAFLLAGAGVATIIRLTGVGSRVAWRPVLHWLSVVVLTTLAIFAVLHHFDRVEDRVEVPFGFFHNVARWGGLLSSPELFTYEPVRSVLPNLVEPRRENQLYLGIVPILAAVILPLAFLADYLRNRQALRSKPLSLPPIFGIWLPAALLTLIFAFGLPFSYFPDWTYENLGAILQFRAPVRFAWPLYYVMGLAAGYGLWLLYGWLARRQKWVAGAVVSVLLLAWLVEGHQFLLTNTNDRSGPNALHPDRLAATSGLAQKNGIDTAHYSAIYLLPSEQGWSDKVFRNGSWRSNHDGYKMSLATGLPLLNGKLSRVSVGWTLASLQLISNPLVDRELLKGLPPDKDLLLVVSRLDDLEAGEQALAMGADTVFANDKVAYLRLPLPSIAARYRTAKANVPEAPQKKGTFLSIPYEPDTAIAFTGYGSRLIEPGWTEIARLPLDTLAPTARYELSLWTYVNRSRFGGPRFFLRLLNERGESLAEQQKWINESPDTQNGWLRATFIFEPPPEVVTVELVGNYFHTYRIDELLLRDLDSPVRISRPDAVLLLNNYRVRR